MHRIVLSSLIFIVVAGCSYNGPAILAGLSSSTTPKDITGSTNGALSLNGAGGSNSSTKKLQRLARATDAAPKGSWERARKGTFNDRDYSGSRLDQEKARRLINNYRFKPVNVSAGRWIPTIVIPRASTVRKL